MITTKQVEKMADEASSSGQFAVAVVLYLLAACVAADKENDLAIYVSPFQDALKESLERTTQARNN